jgi:hypothetical protein
MKMTNHPTKYNEIASAITMMTPSLVCGWFLWNAFYRRFYNSTQRRRLLLASLGCVAHLPWSIGLHIHRAFFPPSATRIFLYKLDVSFIHIHSLLQHVSWHFPRFRTFIVLFHFVCIGFLWMCPQNKHIINGITALGILLSSAELYQIQYNLWLGACVGWFVAGYFYLTGHSALFHLLLGFPQGCLLAGLTI